MISGRMVKRLNIQQTKEYTDSHIIGIVGPKRNMKSLLMAMTIILKLVEGEKVWSNMPVHTGEHILNRRYAPSGKLINYCETEPIDWELFYRLDKSIVEGTVAIDEIGNQASSRESTSVRNRLTNLVVRQAGHRNLDLIYTARSFYRVDYYIREETDLLIECKDLRFSLWGLQNKVHGGIIGNFKYYDLSGSITGKSCYNGYQYDQSKYYMERNITGWPYFDCYDTKEIISLEEACTGIELALKKRRIGNKDKEEDIKQESWLENIVAQIKNKGTDYLTGYQLSNIIGQPLTGSIKRELASLGIFYNRFQQAYEIS